jgi:hypothetical protein
MAYSWGKWQGCHLSTLSRRAKPLPQGGDRRSETLNSSKTIKRI